MAAIVTHATGTRAQRLDPGASPDVDRLIDQLRPGATRGIRVPGGAEGAASGQPARRVAAAPVTAPGTTAPPGIPAASLTVQFATGSAALTPEATQTLDILGRALTSPTLAGSRFRIEGHTDTVGTAGTNQGLSERRAAAVRAYLVSRFGLRPEQLEAVGFGASQLLVPTAEQVPEPRNRRVQILNLSG